tara:strand:- start:1236 stop:2360 length:1125 start_codon:yes stop_codon:yes gene_type:complete
LIKKKIILIGPAFPLRGGIADSNHSLALALKKLGHEVSILSFSLQYPSFLFPGKSQFNFQGPKPDLKIHPLINSINPLSWIKAALWLKSHKPDLVISRFWLPFIGPSLGSVLKLSGLNPKIPLVALCDNVIPHENRFGDRFLTRYFLKSNNQFLVMSNSVGKDISTFVNNPKINYHPHPVYDQFGDLLPKKDALQMLQLNPKKKYVLFFGFIRKYKGLDLLIKALPTINKDVELIVAGEFYESESDYRSLVESLDLQTRVHFFADFIPQENVAQFFSACDLLVQPYRTATQSGVAQIAYHFNKPILVTNVGGLPEIVPHNKVGYVVEVNPNAIALAVNDFYDYNREATFIENVKQEKKKYSWSNMAEQIMKSSK